MAADAFLSHAGLSLRPIRLADLVQFATWRNSPELRQRTREFVPLTLEHQERWYKRVTGPDSKDFMFAIDIDRAVASRALGEVSQFHHASSTTIGVVGLCHWSPRDRLAEVSFYIGDVNYRKKGFAKLALMLLHEWGFSELGLERVWAEVYDFNEPSVVLLKKLGYTEEGRLRGHIWRNGKRHDSIMLGILRDEWKR